MCSSLWKSRSASRSATNWPEDGEQYRQLDVTPFIPDLRNLPNAEVNDRVEETLRKMEEDLPKWAASGRLENTEIKWWRRYLAGCRRETRLRPDLLSLHSLERYHVPARGLVADEEAGSLIAAIMRNHEKERKRTVLSLTRKAPASD